MAVEASNELWTKAHNAFAHRVSGTGQSTQTDEAKGVKQVQSEEGQLPPLFTDDFLHFWKVTPPPPVAQFDEPPTGTTRDVWGKGSATIVRSDTPALWNQVVKKLRSSGAKLAKGDRQRADATKGALKTLRKVKDEVVLFWRNFHMVIGG